MLVAFVGGIATAVGLASGVFGIIAGVESATATHYATLANLKIAVTRVGGDNGNWILHPGTPIEPNSNGFCSHSTVEELDNGVGERMNPTFQVTLSNNFTNGGSGQLYLDGIHAVVYQTEPAIPDATEETCPSAGSFDEAAIGADLDKSTVAYDADATGAQIKTAGAPAVTLTPGETSSFVVGMLGANKTYHADMVGTLRNGNGDHWSVDLTSKIGHILVPGTKGVIFHVTLDQPPSFQCEFHGALTGKAPCTVTAAPTRAAVDQFAATVPKQFLSSQ